MRLTNLLISASAAAFLTTSCSYFSPYFSSQPVAGPSLSDAPAEDPTVGSAEQKTLREARESVGDGGTSQPGTGPGSTSPGSSNPPPVVKKTDYRYAIEIPGKEGFVFNPYTNNPVDVRGIPSGTLVRDPQDTNPDHKFRVP